MTERAGKERNPVTHSTPQGRITSSESQLPSFDPSVPNPARMWNYWLGGKDNFAADREAAERVLQVMPSMPLIARAARLFLIDAVHQLATEYGIRQFLDIGTGLPTADNTHHVAQRAAPESRIVYVDHDPVVLSHAQALLTSSPERQDRLYPGGPAGHGNDPRARRADARLLPAGRRLADRDPAFHPRR